MATRRVGVGEDGHAAAEVDRRDRDFVVDLSERGAVEADLLGQVHWQGLNLDLAEELVDALPELIELGVDVVEVDGHGGAHGARRLDVEEVDVDDVLGEGVALDAPDEDGAGVGFALDLQADGGVPGGVDDGPNQGLGVYLQGGGVDARAVEVRGGDAGAPEIAGPLAEQSSRARREGRYSHEKTPMERCWGRARRPAPGDGKRTRR